MITQVPNWQSLTPEEIRAYLLTTEWVPNTQTVTVATISAAIGLEAAALVIGTVDAGGATNPLLKSSFVALSTTGVQLHTPERQGLIDILAVAGSWPDAVRDAVKALGGSMVPRWQRLGYPIEPTIELIESQVNAATDQQKIAHVQNEIIGGSTVTEYITSLNAAIAYLEA